MSLLNLNLGVKYRSSRDNILEEFIIPCLRESYLYDRAVGFFSGEALKLALNGVIEFIRKRDSMIRIITSPHLREKDVLAIEKGLREEKKVLESAILEEIDRISGWQLDIADNACIRKDKIIRMFKQDDMTLDSPNDLLNKIDEMKKHTQFFTLWPRMWQRYTDSHGWRNEKLQESKVNQIPDSPGIYTLILKPGIAGHPSCSYLMYLGKTGSLRRRFRDYLGKERLKTGRPRIYYFLNKYGGYVCFYYTLVVNTLLDNVEDGLMNAYMPPLNEKYKGEIHRIRRAFP